MKDGSAGNLEVVLCLMEEARAHIVASQAEGKVRIPAVIRSAASHNRIRIAAASRGLRLFVPTAKNPMQPRFPAFLPPSDLRPGAVDQCFHIRATDRGRGERPSETPLNTQPFVEEISHARFYADAGGIKNGRLEMEHGKTEAELPAVVISASVYKSRFWRRYRWISGGGFRR